MFRILGYDLRDRVFVHDSDTNSVCEFTREEVYFLINFVNIIGVSAAGLRAMVFQRLGSVKGKLHLRELCGQRVVIVDNSEDCLDVLSHRYLILTGVEDIHKICDPLYVLSSHVYAIVSDTGVLCYLDTSNLVDDFVLGSICNRVINITRFESTDVGLIIDGRIEEFDWFISVNRGMQLITTDDCRTDVKESVCFLRGLI